MSRLRDINDIKSGGNLTTRHDSASLRNGVVSSSQDASRVIVKAPVDQHSKAPQWQTTCSALGSALLERFRMARSAYEEGRQLGLAFSGLHRPVCTSQLTTPIATLREAGG